jgi:hypothetical protein
MARQPRQPRAHPHLPKELDRYLFTTEKDQFRLRQHWARLRWPITALVLGAIIFLGLSPFLIGSTTFLVLAFFLLIIPLLWLIWAWIDWQRTWFLVTDRRIMLVHGVVIRKVAIMPLSKVTDMAYNRTPLGYLLGYGEYLFESAGQDQALHRVSYVKEPDLHYRMISALIFAPPQRRAYDKLLPFATGSAMPISEPEDAWWKR